MASPFKFDALRGPRLLRLLTLGAAGTLLLAACKREIPFDDPSSRMLTVYSELNPGKEAWVHVTRSTTLMGDGEPTPITDAVVRWTGEDGTLLATATYLPDSLPGAWYITPWRPQEGTQYTLEVEVPVNDELATARVSVPTSAANVRVDSLFTLEPDPNDWFPVRRSTYELAFDDDGTPGVFVVRAFIHNRAAAVWPPLDSNIRVVFSLESQDPLWETNGAIFSRLGTARLALNADEIPNGARKVRVEVGHGDFFDLPNYEIVFAVEKWDADLYRAVVSQERVSGAGSFNPFVQPITSFSNVEGGIGFAGGKSRVWVRK